jgi:hypothetical protein
MPLGGAPGAPGDRGDWGAVPGPPGRGGGGGGGGKEGDYSSQFAATGERPQNNLTGVALVRVRVRAAHTHQPLRLSLVLTGCFDAVFLKYPSTLCAPLPLLTIGRVHRERALAGHVATKKSRIVTVGISGVGDRSRGRFATRADFTLHGCCLYSHVHVSRDSLGLVPRPRTVLCRPNPNATCSPRCQTPTQSERFEGNAAKRELLERKCALVEQRATPALSLTCDLRTLPLSTRTLGTRFDVMLVDPPCGGEVLPALTHLRPAHAAAEHAHARHALRRHARGPAVWR